MNQARVRNHDKNPVVPSCKTNLTVVQDVRATFNIHDRTCKLQNRRCHKTLALDDPITGDFYIYHIGGEYVGYGSTLVEVWRLRWIRDPAFNDGEISCPDWCHWGIENLGGICISPLWNNGECGHWQNHPTYEKEVIEVVGDEYKHMFSTKNPHIFDITRF